MGTLILSNGRISQNDIRWHWHIPQETSSQIKSAVDKKKHIPSNPVNTDTEGPIESVRINRVSTLNGLNLEKM